MEIQLWLRGGTVYTVSIPEIQGCNKVYIGDVTVEVSSSLVSGKIMRLDCIDVQRV